MEFAGAVSPRLAAAVSRGLPGVPPLRSCWPSAAVPAADTDGRRGEATRKARGEGRGVAREGEREDRKRRRRKEKKRERGQEGRSNGCLGGFCPAVSSPEKIGEERGGCGGW